ncbi:YafY family protein [Streptomyces sp. PvR034]|uniref:helix-turn-helix transcriptional regulator n=1 Tax=Streptomyces sp. PvR034 TaxID=3156401 RepID=UPI00339707D9
MVESSARLLRLLGLLQAQREWTGSGLAERLGVTPRTVRRDVDRLRELGYPVNASPGTGGGYQLGAGAELPPLLLDDDEAVAVAIGLRTGIGEASVRALAKLERVLPARLRHRVPALDAGPGRAAADPSVLAELAALCRDGERLRFGYRDHAGASTRRTVEPHRLVCTERRWYLVAWDLERAAWRTFRADRIEPRPPHGPRFTPRPSPAEGVSHRGYAARAVVRLRLPAEEAARTIGPSDGALEPLDAHSCLLRTGAVSLDVLVIHLMLLGCEFEVVEPPELTARIRAARDLLGRAVAPAEGTDSPRVEKG